MLYQLYEWQQASLLPVRLAASANMVVCSWPLNPFSYSPMARTMVAAADVLLRTTRRYEKPRFGLTETVIDGKPTALSEDVAVKNPFCTLLHFKRDTGVRQPTVLVVA